MLVEPTLRSDLLADRVAIVTGGSRGIGGATSEMLAANGARVVIAEVEEVKAVQTARNIESEYGADRGAGNYAAAKAGTRSRRSDYVTGRVIAVNGGARGGMS